MIRLVLCGIALFVFSQQVSASVHNIIDERAVEEKEKYFGEIGSDEAFLNHQSTGDDVFINGFPLGLLEDYSSAGMKSSQEGKIFKKMPDGTILEYSYGLAALEDMISDYKSDAFKSHKKESKIRDLERKYLLHSSMKFSPGGGASKNTCNGQVSFSTSFWFSGYTNWVDVRVVYNEFSPLRPLRKKLTAVARAGYWLTEDDDEYTYRVINETPWFSYESQKSVSAFTAVVTSHPGMYGKGYIEAENPTYACYARFYLHNDEDFMH